MISVAAAIADVLRTSDPHHKIMLARQTTRRWRKGQLGWSFDVPMPVRPARPANPELLPPGKMPRRKKAGSLRGRIAMLHALAHIEFVAVDLAFDMAGRFGGQMPRAFIDDWLSVGAEEAMHFALLDRRLRNLQSSYGALPAHDGLWETAAATASDAAARTALVPMVLEARGLDVTPDMIGRFHAAGDVAAGKILKRIHDDEIRHVAVGVRWFQHLCAAANKEPVEAWQMLVRQHFKGGLKGPFNSSARLAAGLTTDFYLPLAVLEPSRH